MGNGNLAFPSVVVAVEPFSVFGLEHLTRRGAESIQRVSFQFETLRLFSALGFVFIRSKRL